MIDFEFNISNFQMFISSRLLFACIALYVLIFLIYLYLLFIVYFVDMADGCSEDTNKGLWN